MCIMSTPVAYDAPHMPFSLPTGNMYNSPNMQQGSVSQTLSENQQPLGTQFKSYNLNQAVNYYTLDPFQYNITKFDYALPDGKKTENKEQYQFKNNPGLVYKGVNFEELLPAYTQAKRSVNDFRAQDYHRFLANEGYFNPKESVDNSDLWYYGADKNSRQNGLGIAGAALNVQEVNRIIFPEAQRGGTNSKNLAKYSWSNYKPVMSQAYGQQARTGDCKVFDFNSNYVSPADKVYQFDSEYCRNIGISGPYEGSMPFNPVKIL
jgi:hypothetical protein